MMKSRPVTISQPLEASPGKIWEALTNPDRMRQWFFNNILDFRPEPGFATEFNVQSGERVFIHQWKVLEVVPQKILVLDWRYGGYSGRSVVTFEIITTQGKTHLRVTHEGLESFPQNVPELSRESCRGGWAYFIGNRLPEYLL